MINTIDDDDDDNETSKKIQHTHTKHRTEKLENLCVIHT